jgi:hypothetical protein
VHPEHAREQHNGHGLLLTLAGISWLYPARARETHTCLTIACHTWAQPGCLRLIARRTPRPATTPAKHGEHPDWEYGAFAHQHPRRAAPIPQRATPHPGPRRRPHKAVQGLRRPHLPSIDYGPTSAWLQLAALATSLTAWLRHLALDGELAKASTKTLRFRLFSAPAR